MLPPMRGETRGRKGTTTVFLVPPLIATRRAWGRFGGRILLENLTQSVVQYGTHNEGLRFPVTDGPRAVREVLIRAHDLGVSGKDPGQSKSILDQRGREPWKWACAFSGILLRKEKEASTCSLQSNVSRAI